MEQQLAGTVRVVVLVGGRQVGRDVSAPEPHLAVIDHGIRLVDLSLAVAQRLHLAAAKLDARLHPLQELELVAGTPVGRDVAARRGPRSLRFPGHQTSKGNRSTLPRGASTRSTVTVAGSPMRTAGPPRVPTSIVSVASSS